MLHGHNRYGGLAMKRLLSLSIRTHMLMMVVLMAAIAFGAVIHDGLEQRAALLREARNDTARLASQIVSEQQNLVAGGEQLLSVLSQLPIVQKHDAAAVTPLLRDIVAQKPQYANLLMIDRSGLLWASAVPARGPLSYADRMYFRNTLASGRFTSGEYVLGRILRKPTLAFAAPIRDRSGTITGVAAIAFSLDKYLQLLEGAKLPKGSSFRLIDHRGTIMYSVLVPHLVGKQDVAENFRRMESGPDEGSFEGKGHDGTRRIFAYRKLRLPGEKTPYMYVRTSIPYDGALKGATSTLTRKLIVLSSLMLIPLCLAVFISKRCVMDKVRALRDAARRLADGDLETKVSEHVIGGELGELGAAFDNMARSLSRDTAERRKVEEALHETAELLHSTLSSLDEIVFVMDRKRRFINVFQTGKDPESFLPPERFIGRHYREAGLPVDVVESFDHAFSRLIRSGRPQSFDYTMELSTGTRWYSATIAIRRNSAGTFVGTTMVSRDITERKKTEMALAEKRQQLEELNHTLERRIGETVADIRRKDQMLIQQGRQAAMGEMIHNIAHQWRQPLNNVGLIIQNLAFMFSSGELTDDELQREVRNAMDVLCFMSRTIDDFRNFFHQEKEKQGFPIQTVVQRTLDFIAPSLRERSIAVDVAACEEVAAFGYPNEYSQVLLNILNNSRDVLMERGTTSPRISIRVFSENGLAVVTVRDNGGGIAEDVLPRIFDPYFSTKEPGKGTGIGLYMSRVIIEKNMGGNLRARTIEDGAEFRIELPPV